MCCAASFATATAVCCSCFADRAGVVIVGTMHYNPRSVALARTVVEEEAATGDLRAVAVESCPTRWNATLDSQPAGSVLRWLCDNEMQSASEAGEAAGATIVLADQTIEETGQRISQLLALTVAQLLTPWAVPAPIGNAA